MSSCHFDLDRVLPALLVDVDTFDECRCKGPARAAACGIHVKSLVTPPRHSPAMLHPQQPPPLVVRVPLSPRANVSWLRLATVVLAGVRHLIPVLTTYVCCFTQACTLSAVLA